MRREFRKEFEKYKFGQDIVDQVLSFRMAANALAKNQGILC
jgi:hypothetical protein